MISNRRQRLYEIDLGHYCFFFFILNYNKFYIAHKSSGRGQQGREGNKHITSGDFPRDQGSGEKKQSYRYYTTLRTRY